MKIKFMLEHRKVVDMDLEINQLEKLVVQVVLFLTQ